MLLGREIFFAGGNPETPLNYGNFYPCQNFVL